MRRIRVGLRGMGWERGCVESAWECGESGWKMWEMWENNAGNQDEKLCYLTLNSNGHDESKDWTEIKMIT